MGMIDLILSSNFLSVANISIMSCLLRQNIIWIFIFFKPYGLNKEFVLIAMIVSIGRFLPLTCFYCCLLCLHLSDFIEARDLITFEFIYFFSDL